ncbi:pentatricopeptide repeat-containing protein [Quercus suber]|uniref:Pentatricopeptide repeat-containing protein n=1 Tax=Quercus suber TaxID=58331 RepID=A0AAW0JX97_QUESU
MFHLLTLVESNIFQHLWHPVEEGYDVPANPKGIQNMHSSNKNCLVTRNVEMGWSSNVVIYTTLIDGCCKNGDIERAKELFCKMGELGLVANQYTYTEMGWSSNVVIYTTLIDGCCKNGDIERAKELFCKMGELGLVANQYTYTVLINGFFKKGLKKDGFELYEEMKHNGVFTNL